MGLPALSNGVIVGIGLFLLLLVPYLLWEIRRGKARGHTWFTWWKPAGHSDIGPDTGPRPTTPGGSIRHATRGSETLRVDGSSSEAGCSRPARLTRD